MQYLHLQSCQSTQDRIQSVTSGWFLLWSDEQTAGRGTHDRQWQSPPGGLYYSLAFPASLIVRDAPLVLLGGAFVWKRLLSDRYPALKSDLALKWPNDLLYGDRKLAGFIANKHSDMFYLGVGLNVNNPIRNKQEQLRRPAISLTELTDRTLSRRALLFEWLERFRTALEASSSTIFDVDRLEDHLSTLGLTVKLDNQSGTAEGLGEAGELEVEVDGAIQRVHSPDDVEVVTDETRG